MVNLTAFDFKTRMSHWAMLILLFINLLVISGGYSQFSTTEEKVTSGKLAGNSRIVRSSHIFYQSFIQKIRSNNFLRGFLSSSDQLSLWIQNKSVQIQLNINSLVILRFQRPIGYLSTRMILYSSSEQSAFLFKAS
ncbi:hypothetical protein H7F33_14155 [Pedobacter sp. PAMC26386]|nr:hypothetical protein H7F33_14155 [Pedobacter sp. PAMC26386]